MNNRIIRMLLLGVGGNVSQGILTALRHSNLNCKIIGACVSPESLGLFFCDKAYISPYANDPKFIDWVGEVCRKENIDIVLSGVEENLVALESKRPELKKLGIPFFNTPLHLLEVGNDKLSTCSWLKENGLNYPKFADASDPDQVKELVLAVGYPILAKPAKGKGSAGIFVINNDEQLLSAPQKGYVYQELIGTPDTEYTVGCYNDRYGELKGLIIMQRWLKHGTTFKAEIVHNEAIKDECERICKLFKAVGPLNIQLRMHEGKPVCFELNVRFSGTTPIRAHWGFNDVEAFIREYLFDEEVSFSPAKEGIVYRYYNEAYVNPDMIRELGHKGFVDTVESFGNVKE